MSNQEKTGPVAPAVSAESSAPKEEAPQPVAVADAAVPLEEKPDAAATATPAISKKAPKGVRVRSIHPLSAGGDSCLEMYSMCTGKPELCTSAPLHLDCGQESALPGQREWLRCVCP